MPRISKADQARQKNAQKARVHREKIVTRIQEERKIPGQKAALMNLVDFFREGGRPFCSHLLVGSSKFLDLIRGKLGARDVHTRKADREDYEIGSRWERHVADLGFIPSQKHDFIKFSITEKDPLYRSDSCAFLIGQPDFRAKMTNPNGSSQQILIEVKSTNRPENFLAFKTGRAYRQIYQTQVCLQCAGIDKAFLVFARGTAQTPEKSDHVEYRVIQVFREPNFIERHRKQLQKGYARFLAELASFPHSPTKSLLEFAENQILENENHFFPRADSERRSGGDAKTDLAQNFRRQCKINRLIIKEEMARQGMTRTVGRPRKKGSELVRPRYGRKTELGYQIRFPSEN